jgi:hypothetical protein
MKTFSKLSFIFASILLFAVPNSLLAGDIAAGVSNNVDSTEAQPGFIDFDPPCVFSQTLPLQTYMHSNTNAYFLLGNGAVLDECSNFGVTGQSPPNFLAWNDAAINWDGSVPALPALIYFPSVVPDFSANLGAGGGTTGTVYLIAYDAGFNIVDFDSASITTNLQNLSVSATAIRAVVIAATYTSAEHWMVVDDLRF